MRDPRWPFDPPRGIIRPTLGATIITVGVSITVTATAVEHTARSIDAAWLLATWGRARVREMLRRG